MIASGLIARLWTFSRTYLVALLLLGAFGKAMFEVFVTGTGPVPQQPPEGYTIERLTATLQWNKGTREEPIKLQVSVDDPDFSAPIVDRDATGTTHAMRNLEAGHTYYWRLMQAGKSSPVAYFKTSAYAIKF